MKKVLITLFIILLCSPILNNEQTVAQDKTFIAIGGVGVATMDKQAGNYEFGGGYAISVNQQVTSNLVIGVSYVANKITGKADFSTLNTQSATAVSRYFFKSISGTKLNFYMLAAGGWMGLKSDEKTDNVINGIIGGGIAWDMYEGVTFVAEPTIWTTEELTAFVIQAGLCFPFDF